MDFFYFTFRKKLMQQANKQIMTLIGPENYSIVLQLHFTGS
jgi:hypothetical protein